MTVFDPARFNFVKLEDFRIPGDVLVYEYRNHPAVDGREDFLRLNLYMTVDGEYVTIWHGLLEPMFAEAECENGRLASVTTPDDFDFGNYTEDLFRGHIDSDETAAYIFKALRVRESPRYRRPQVLRCGVDNGLRCDWLQEADPART